MHLAHAHRIRQLGHLTHPFDRAGQLVRIQLQPGHQGGCQVSGCRGLQISGIGRDDCTGLSLEGIGHREDGLPSLLITATPQGHRSGSNATSALQ